MVGDIVRLDETVGKDFRNCEAQITKLGAKMATVTVTTGKKKPVKVVRFQQCTVIQPSTLRGLMIRKGRVPNTAPGAPETGSSAPDIAVAAVWDDEGEDENEGTAAAEADDDEAKRLVASMGLGDSDCEIQS